MKKIIFCFIYLALQITVFAQKRVVVTVDDLPVVGGIDYEDRLQITRDLVKKFKDMDIPAIGFVNERKLYKNGIEDSAEIQLLAHWLKNGLELGNHTFSHPNYHKTSFDDYTADILKGERITKPLSEKYGLAFRYFRHPYLRIGSTKQDHEKLKTFLEENDYEEAPVTIDNADYLFAAAYNKAYKLNDTSMSNKVTDSYIPYMYQKLFHYEIASDHVAKRQIPQILLIHANRLNADTIERLLQVYENMGYKFIPMEEAMSDYIFDSEIEVYGDWGISWLDRWGMTLGRTEHFKNDIPTPTFLQEYLDK